jgi:hypothetical protein
VKTVKVIRSVDDLSGMLVDYVKLMNNSDPVEFIMRYRQKQPILLKKGTRKCYPVFASPNHPKSKAIHEMVIRIEMKRHRMVRVPGRGARRPYQIQHHRSERPATAKKAK